MIVEVHRPCGGRVPCRSHRRDGGGLSSRVVGSGHGGEGLYYRSSYGRWHQDRRSMYRSSAGEFFVTVLMMLAGIVVIASLIH